MSVVFVRRWLVAFFIAIGIILIVTLSLRTSYQESYVLEAPTTEFQWINIENLTEFRACRNSIQGALLIVDERGFVCSRKDLSASGCCHSRGESTKRYECTDCQNNNCCSIYEHCVSCCLNPDHKNLLEQILNFGSSVPNVISKSVSDQFELCLVKCRTSSKSVWHENSYKDKTFKHCFGLSGPDFATM
ncbi:hypothetical protein OS493_004009 [Desmophyllum pertusum]|uniref:SREBP regulating gene protein n=1 Tax=Desmophyllum pertusum TaxID=174260 RepID=A0A9X0D4Y3_9CNID|nr:hypothetical protein OS493_004009 [Desmophyllum pertusum]